MTWLHALGKFNVQTAVSVIEQPTAEFREYDCDQICVDVWVIKGYKCFFKNWIMFVAFDYLIQFKFKNSPTWQRNVLVCCYEDTKIKYITRIV